MTSIVIRTLIIYLILSFSLRIMGKRQLGELDVSELVSTLLISEIASIPIDDPDIPLMNAIIPILLILSTEILLSTIKNKSEKMKGVIEGKPQYIIYKGRLLEKALHDNRISLNEFLSALRSCGVFSIATVEYAILEENGKISVFPKAGHGAVTYLEMQNGVSEHGIGHAVVVDGQIMEDELRLSARDRKWVEKMIRNKKCDLRDVFLMTVDDSGEVYIVRKERGV